MEKNISLLYPWGGYRNQIKVREDAGEIMIAEKKVAMNFVEDTGAFVACENDTAIVKATNKAEKRRNALSSSRSIHYVTLCYGMLAKSFVFFESGMGVCRGCIALQVASTH
jgi:hypothetical protein